VNGDQPFFVLDADDRIAQVTEEYHESMARFLGHALWEYLPGSEPLVRPLLEEARHTGCASSSAIFYAGGIMDVRVVPAGDSVAVYTTRRTELNVRTPRRSHRACRGSRPSQPLESPGNTIDQLPRLCKLFPERRQLGCLPGHRVRSPHEVADRRLCDLGDASEAWQGRDRDSTFPARHRDRLDSQRFGELTLSHACGPPRRAQANAHSAALLYCHADEILSHSASEHHRDDRAAESPFPRESVSRWGRP
jgi:hypothetical protein